MEIVHSLRDFLKTHTLSHARARPNIHLYIYIYSYLYEIFNITFYVILISHIF